MSNTTNWNRKQGGHTLCGITQKACHEIGEIVFIELPEVGRVVGLGELVAGDEVDSKMVFEDFDVFLCGNRGEERALDLASGDVFGMKNPAFGMAAFFAEVQ